ncbi:hypothetical protein BU24DRAFT_465580 [Aaosphaeria arxii CBS 175.79]|uniref:C2H2-type domain-containing protein n=1 Tax=Aaosphaeria arxii CBS 175.79 TaxID=1450172 RepID=A0A6A5XGM2_9PLEO|nr:uncharacterized protein BU24DRAFT_465580 [Aaosphaeria arxii CBS 175.79]KAF2012006.1 hypothetical protein BU24DRAFT_465580 [Aaosphaeria arxii CBS 175.79]
MPWTIWPALIILWGVCWMFYEPLNPQWEIDLLEIEDSSGQLLSLDCNLPDFDWDAPEWSLSHPDFIDPEQQLQQLMPGLSSSLTIPESGDSLQISSTVKPQDTICPRVSTDEAPGTFNVATSVATSSATREIGEEQQLEAVEPTAFAAPDIPSPFHEKPRDGPQSVGTDARHTKGFQNSRHGHIQKYYCPYPNCGRSKEGFGFRRKDHLDQHLKGPHKQSSVARLRGRPATGSSSFNSVATSDIARALSQTKKRKHNEHGDLAEHSVNEPSDVLVKELAEERRLRLEAEQENQRLRQKLEKYEERMEKYEERLDRMMTLFGNNKSEETNLG